MHRLLARQLKKFWPAGARQEQFQDLIEAIEAAYEGADHDRLLVERSLELTSQELYDRNVQLREKLSQLELTRDQLQKIVATVQATFDASREGVFSLDSATGKVSCNRIGRVMLDLPDDHTEFPLIQVVRTFFKNLSEPQALRNAIDRDLKHNSSSGEIFVTTEFTNGRDYEIYSVPTLMDGKQSGRVWNFRDVTEYRMSQELIEHQANHDALTNLPNRTLFKDRVEHAISFAQRDDHLLGVLFLDLDHFKKVNDTAGHIVGDTVLKQVAHRIADNLREGDTLARIGGDEFVILVEKVTSSQLITHLASRIQKALIEPFQVESSTYVIGSSIGISLYPRDAENVDELLRKADISMYHAKRSGRSNFQYFDESLERFALYQLGLESDIRVAIDADEFELYYQPKVTLPDADFTSAEALLRWQKDGKFVSPAEFIKVAEQTGLIHDLSRWVFRQVCSQIQSWGKAGKAIPTIAVNISSINIKDHRFKEFIEQTIQTYQIDGRYLEFEITESVLLENTKIGDDFIAMARNLGIRFSMDDFGTGYSSLSYLHKFPVDTIKIDKSFILKLFAEKYNQVITHTIISLANNLGLNVVAEGVETQAVHQWLIDQGCQCAQGYFYHKPLPESDFTALLKSKK